MGTAKRWGSIKPVGRDGSYGRVATGDIVHSPGYRRVAFSRNRGAELSCTRGLNTGRWRRYVDAWPWCARNAGALQGNNYRAPRSAFGDGEVGNAFAYSLWVEDYLNCAGCAGAQGAATRTVSAIGGKGIIG